MFVLEMRRYCYERVGLPEELQFSDPPAAAGKGIRWRHLGAPHNESDPFVDLAAEPVLEVHPMDACPLRCAHRIGTKSE